MKLDKQRVEKAEQELINAMKSANIHELDKLLHDHLLFNLPNGLTITKAIDIETYATKTIQVEKINVIEQSINLIADNAVVTTVIKMKGKHLSAPIDGKYKIIRVWKNFPDGLKVIAGSNQNL